MRGGSSSYACRVCRRSLSVRTAQGQLPEVLRTDAVGTPAQVEPLSSVRVWHIVACRPMLLEPRRLASYILLEQIGHGGMAVVYRARQESLDRTVAVKVLSESLAAAPEFLERFRREARTAANLRHPNLITVHDFGEDERGVPYLVLEYIEGATLADLMDVGLDDSRIPDLLDQIAAGLDYAHAHGVIHRDIKPGNVLTTEDGRVVLADFGLAWLLDGAHLTMTGGVIGPPEYMIPEQAAGQPIEHRSAVYALGVVLYVMLGVER